MSTNVRQDVMLESISRLSIAGAGDDSQGYRSENLPELHHNLNERIKELQCLYGITQLVERCGDNIRQILQGVVDLIPPSWQFPEITCAKITFEGEQFMSSTFNETKWRQSAEITVNGVVSGILEVTYLNEMPDSDEGPFLKEERSLINAISERMGRIAERISAQNERQQLHYHMQERVKELQCLYGISQLVENHGDDVPSILDGIVKLIPPSWQFPEVTCARLSLRNLKYQTDGFRITPWTQSAEIVIDGKSEGQVEVCYVEEMPSSDEGPFLKEERSLIDAISERIGRVAERLWIREKMRYAQEELKMERAMLRESNSALRVVLSRIEDEKKTIKDTIATNVDKILMPTLYMLESEVPVKQKAYVELLKGSLQEIASPLIDRLTRDYLNLTPIETQVCNMIRRGLTTKEIAGIRHVAPATVRGQRESIRRKLGLLRRSVNLTTFLQTYEAKHVSTGTDVGVEDLGHADGTAEGPDQI